MTMSMAAGVLIVRASVQISSSVTLRHRQNCRRIRRQRHVTDVLPPSIGVRLRRR